MSKYLILIRHGEAAERESDQTDFDRFLTGNGVQAVSNLGRHLSNKNTQPDIIITSPAVRAFGTAQLVAEQLNYDSARIHNNEEIYEASVRTLLQVVNQLKEEWNSVLLVGHNPSISYLAEYITEAEIGDMSPGSAAQISFELDKWPQISAGTGTLLEYTPASKLTEGE